MGWVAPVASAVTAVTAVAAAENASAAGKFNEDVANRNATIKENEAVIVEQNKELALAKFDKSFEKLEGQTKTAVLFSGAELSGSGLRIMRQNAEEAELEREIIAYNFNIEKQRKFEEANFARMGGTIARNQAKSAELGYYAQASTSLLRGFG